MHSCGAHFEVNIKLIYYNLTDILPTNTQSGEGWTVLMKLSKLPAISFIFSLQLNHFRGERNNLSELVVLTVLVFLHFFSEVKPFF